MAFPAQALIELFLAQQEQQAAQAENARVEAALDDAKRSAEAAQAQAEAVTKEAQTAIKTAREDARQSIGKASIESQKGMGRLWRELQECKKKSDSLQKESRYLRAYIQSFGQMLQYMQ